MERVMQTNGVGRQAIISSPAFGEGEPTVDLGFLGILLQDLDTQAPMVKHRSSWKHRNIGN